MKNNNKKVFVAMSGGVDSSVVAGLLKDQGYDVVGVTMCFSITNPSTKRPSCCGVEGINDAKRAAQILGIPHYMLDFSGDIDEYIIEDFVNEYLNGRTPNPCVRCNQFLKFGTLYNKVKSMGADYLATGHYVKVLQNANTGEYEMWKAKDDKKDQTYFLYSTPKEILPSLLFPLGEMTKAQVRALAEKYQLNVADKPESQDICFVPDEGYKAFLENRLGKEVFKSGDFVNEKGEVVGQHKGISHYTIGQRDKLGIALGYPAYVYEIDKKTNTVHVGPKEMLYANGLIASHFNNLGYSLERESVEVSVQIRYNSPQVKARVTWFGEDCIKINFDKPQTAVTPGQSVVLYDKDQVLGGAVIESKIT